MQSKLQQAEALFEQALKLHQSGRIEEAEAAYRDVLHITPENAGAIFLFGLCHHQRGDHSSAITLMDIAIEINPRMPQAHYNRGLALQKLERHGEAIVSYDQAIALQPEYAQAYNNRGNALQLLGQYSLALHSYERAIAIAPNHAEAHTNRGNVLKDMGRFEEALSCHETALFLREDHPEAWCNRGNVLKKMKRLQEAIDSYDRAIALRPEFIEAVINRGDTLHEMGRKDDALASYSRAIAIQPTSALAHEMRGNLLMSAKHYVEALADLERAVKLAPRSLAASAQLAHVKMLLCDWKDLPRLLQNIREQVRQGEAVSNPFALLSLLESPEEQLVATRQYAAEWFPKAGSQRWNGERYQHDRIRVAYFSSDFRNHAVAYLTAGLFEHHDRTRFEIHGFYLGPPSDDVWHQRIRSAFDHFHDLKASSDDEIAALARRLEIDIIVDLNGHTEGARMDALAQRPAPIQISYLGHPGTTGTDYIDYIVADRIVIPEMHRKHYSEKAIWLPCSFQINDNKKAISETPTSRRTLGLPENGFVFCCFNNSYKITPDVFDIWMQLLQQVEGSVLWLAEANPTARKNLIDEAGRQGIGAARLVFAARMPLAEYLASYRHADLFLDTFCYNAGTTASDALWAGLPVITCPGQAFAQRMAASLLNAVNLPELVAETPAAYASIALDLACHPDRIRVIRERLQQEVRTGSLFDTAATTRHLEQAYELIMNRHDAGLPPDHIVVSAHSDKSGG